MPVDYSKLSDAELDALLAQEPSKPAAKDYASMTDEELDAELNKTSTPIQPSTPPEMSKVESAFRGAGQGISAGFADELSGAAGYLGGKLGIVPDMGYDYYRDYARNQDKAAAAANPYSYGAGQLGGGIATAAIPGLGAANSFKGAAGVGAALGGASGVGSSEADLLSAQMAQDALTGATIGGVAGGAGQKLGSYLTGSKEAVGRLNTLADDMAEKATGATAAQAEKFADGAGGILRKQKLVRFGDSPENIANRVAAAQKSSGENIGRALKQLDDQGVTASVDNVVATLEGEIAELNKIPGNEKIIRKLQKEIDNLYNRGESSLQLSFGEQAKRNFQDQVNWLSSNNKRSAAYKISDAFRDEVENAATNANPELAAQFIKDKQLFSVLKPVKEASQRRATQLNQSPWGGVGDMMSMASGGPKVALARRVFAPRLSSSASATAGMTADSLAAINRILGKSADPIADLIQLGARAEGTNKKQSPWMGMTKKEKKK